MENENGQYFDLTILLRFGDLELMKVVNNNLSLKVADYFNLLLKVENNLTKGVKIFNRISDYKGDDNDLDNLETVKNSLEDIGYKKTTRAIDDIIKARRNGRIDVAADSAKETLKDFEKLQRQITAAKKTRKPEAPAEGADDDSTPHENYETQYLRDTLLQLNQEEADRKLRILAVDDAPVMIKTISSILNDDYKVYGMTHPKMLEKFLEQITPDLFLLDYQMPEINGFELIPIIRKFEEHKETPIIFLTSMGTMEHVSAALALGACDFIVKPFQGDNLHEKVTKHIVRKKLLLDL